MFRNTKKRRGFDIGRIDNRLYSLEFSYKPSFFKSILNIWYENKSFVKYVSNVFGQKQEQKNWKCSAKKLLNIGSFAVLIPLQIDR